MDEIDYWKRVAAYLAECHAETAEHEGNLSRTSKSSRARFAAVCQSAADAMAGCGIKRIHGSADERVNAAFLRCSRVAQEIK